jgi:hypothetical protein
MKRGLRIHFDISCSASNLRFCLIALMLVSAAVDVASESVTLATYYPAPSGVYAQMITTGNTYLSRDSGNVGIGTMTPAQKLEVNGSVKIDGAGIYNTSGFQLVETSANDWTRWNQGSSAANGNVMYQSLALPTGGLSVGTLSSQGLGNIYATGTLQVAGAGSSYIQGNLGVGPKPGGSFPASTLDVNGTIVSRGCNGVGLTAYPGGTIYCGGGTYATWITGVMTQYQYANNLNGNGGTNSIPPEGEMYCCPCQGSCPSL